MVINYAFNIFQKSLALHGKYGYKKSMSSIIEDEDKEERHNKNFHLNQSSSSQTTIVFLLVHVDFHIYYSIGTRGGSELFKVSLS